MTLSFPGKLIVLAGLPNVLEGRELKQQLRSRAASAQCLLGPNKETSVSDEIKNFRSHRLFACLHETSASVHTFRRDEKHNKELNCAGQGGKQRQNIKAENRI